MRLFTDDTSLLHNSYSKRIIENTINTDLSKVNA